MPGIRVVACLICLFSIVACLERPESLSDETGVTAYQLEPAPRDIRLCEQIAKRELSCYFDGEDAEPAADQIQVCAARFACSRRMWREEIVDAVYACIPARPCDDVDPAMTCLDEVAADGPSTAAREFNHLLDDGDCPDVIEIAPGQSDEVYDALASCLATDGTCVERGRCARRVLRKLVDETCSAR